MELIRGLIAVGGMVVGWALSKLQPGPAVVVDGVGRWAGWDE